MYRLTNKEEQVMQQIWKLKAAFVKDIIEGLPDPKPPYNTISSIVRKLEKQGAVGYEAFGKTHRYYPIWDQEKYAKLSINNLVANYFKGSAEALLSFFVKEESISEEELHNLIKQIKD